MDNAVTLVRDEKNALPLRPSADMRVLHVNLLDRATGWREGPVGLAAACDYLESIGMNAVRAHEVSLMTDMMRRLGEIPQVRMFGPRDPEQRSGVLSFNVGDIHPHDLSTVLDQGGVCIRAGHHCAQPLMRRLDVPATARASVYLYNDASDLDALVQGIRRAMEMFG